LKKQLFFYGGCMGKKKIVCAYCGSSNLTDIIPKFMQLAYDKSGRQCKDCLRILNPDGTKLE